MKEVLGKRSCSSIIFAITLMPLLVIVIITTFIATDIFLVRLVIAWVFGGGLLVLVVVTLIRVMSYQKKPRDLIVLDGDRLILRATVEIRFCDIQEVRVKYPKAGRSFGNFLSYRYILFKMKNGSEQSQYDVASPHKVVKKIRNILKELAKS